MDRWKRKFLKTEILLFNLTILLEVRNYKPNMFQQNQVAWSNLKTKET